MNMKIMINYYGHGGDNFETYTTYGTEFKDEMYIHKLTNEILEHCPEYDEEDEICEIQNIEIVDEDYNVIFHYSDEDDFNENAYDDYSQYLRMEILLKQGRGKCVIKDTATYNTEDGHQRCYDVVTLQADEKYRVEFKSKTVKEARKYIAENNLEYFDEKVRQNPYYRRTKSVENPLFFMWKANNEI